MNTQEKKATETGASEDQESMAHRLVALAKEAGAPVEEQTSWYKIKIGARAVYVSKSNRTPGVNLAGFSFEHPAVRPMSADEAKEHKLGRVRAQIDFSKDEGQTIEAFLTAIALMVNLAQVPEDQQVPVKVPTEQVQA